MFRKVFERCLQKFYIQFYSTREAAARLSWECHNIYNSENEKKESDLRERILEKKSCPEVEDIESWVVKSINLLKLSGTEVDHPGLMEMVKIFKNELHFQKAKG